MSNSFKKWWTYRRYHLVFNVPALLGLAFWPGGSEFTATSWVILGILFLIVMVFTSPWDNHAVACGLWDFPQEKIWFRIKHLPVEEYAFFLLQTTAAVWLMHRLQPVFSDIGLAENWALDQPGVLLLLGLWAVAFLGLGLWGRNRIGKHSRCHYAWHLLYWFGAIIAVQWIVAGPLLWDALPLLFTVAFGLGLYYSLSDLLAIYANIWFFDHKQTTGHRIGGIMPWEEAAFFVLTSLLVAQSYWIMLPSPLRAGG
ncbi:MAG: lycopene cyclase domain-containing protein [Verrucomicrobiales bacterium]